ncbi:MAG: hypothetical protein AAF993_13710, partial [Pseudomonadota bacterium]
MLVSGLLWVLPGWAIPPDTPIVNTAQVTYAVAGHNFQISDSATLRTDASAGNSVPLSASLSSGLILENLPGGLIGVLVVQDLDPADTHTFTLSDPRFVITGSSLSLAPGVALDFETGNSIDLNVTVIDSQGGVLNTTVSITVEDVNEAPLSIMLDAATVSAATPGAVVGNLGVLDPDLGDVHTWVPDDPRFVVVDSVLRLADGVTLPLGETVNLQLEATDSGGLSVSDVFVIDVVPPGGGSGDAASISALVHAPGAAGAQTIAVQASRCDAGSGLQDLPPPVAADGSVLGLSAPLPLLPSAITTAGAAVFIQVIDASADLDATITDRLRVQLQNAGGDQESVELAETGANTGVFAGHFPVRRSSPASADCVLGVALDDTITMTYIDADNPADQAVVQIRVDPISRVFESSTGQLLSGVQLTLLESPSGLPATVFAEDGVTPYWPSSPHTPEGEGRDRFDYNDNSAGDAHAWSVWFGGKPFEAQRNWTYRFMSEFGFQSFPELRTIESFTEPEDRSLTGWIMDYHQRSPSGNEKIYRYLLDWFKPPRDLETSLWLTQLTQALCIEYAADHARRIQGRMDGLI